MSAKENESNSMKLYRIGDYAKYMGVTPDFLKHYEQFRLIHAITGENGYRYYPFSESFKIFECMKLKNHGFTIKEMDRLLSDCSESEVLASLADKADALEEELRFQQELLSEYRKFDAFMRKMNGKSSDWWIGTAEPMFFLPHTKWRQFLDDERVYALLDDWVHWMPIVRSAMMLPQDSLRRSDFRADCVWGLVMPQSLAEKHNLPLNDVVIRLPERKAFYYHYCEHRRDTDASSLPLNDMLKTLDSLSLSPAGPVLDIMFMSTHINDIPAHNGRLIVPLE